MDLAVAVAIHQGQRLDLDHFVVGECLQRMPILFRRPGVAVGGDVDRPGELLCFDIVVLFLSLVPGGLPDQTQLQLDGSDITHGRGWEIYSDYERAAS